MTEEEREHKYPYVAAVNVGIGHAHYFMIPELAGIEFLVYARAERRYHGAYFIIGKYFVHARFFNV